MTGPTALGRSTRVMAIGTVASRGSGFLRTAVIAAALGVKGLATAYAVANTAPNILFELLLGAVLTSVVVPLLVRAAKEDEDGGVAYAQRLFSLTVIVLAVASVVLVLAAPLIVAAYSPHDLPAAQRDLATTFARCFLPQILFYGAGAIMGAILNTRGSFAAPMWAPVLNNVVVIVTAVVFLLLPGSATVTGITTGQVAVLGIGTTLGIVVQTVALVPALRRAGFALRLRRDLRDVGLRRLAEVGRWVLVYVLANQVAYLVVVRLATSAGDDASGRGYPSYTLAFTLWQLPHAVVAVSVISALLPAMSRAAADDRLADVGAQLSRGLRLVGAVLVPAAAAFVALGPVLASVVYAHGATSGADARYIGTVLAAFALGLLPFSAFQLQLRAFYALQDTRTPALVNVWVNAANIAVDLLLYAVLPARQRVLGLALGYAASYAVGVVLTSRALSRRLGGLEGPRVLQVLVRCVVAALPAGVLGFVLARLVTAAVGRGLGGSLLAGAVGGGALVVAYAMAARRMHVRELDTVLGPVLARLSRSST